MKDVSIETVPTEVVFLTWHCHRHEKDDSNESRPDTSPSIDKGRCFTQMPWTRLELAEGEFTQDGNAVAPIKSNSRDVENTQDSRIAAQTNKVDSDTPEDGNPDSIKRRTSALVELCPDLGTRNQPVSRKGEDCAAE